MRCEDCEKMEFREIEKDKVVCWCNEKSQEIEYRGYVRDCSYNIKAKGKTAKRLEYVDDIRKFYYANYKQKTKAEMARELKITQSEMNDLVFQWHWDNDGKKRETRGRKCKK